MDLDEKKKYIFTNQADSFLMAQEVVFDNPNIVRSEKNLYRYNGRYYDLIDDEDLVKMYQLFVGNYGITKQWKGGKISEVVRFIKNYDKIPDVEMNGKGNLLCLANGVLNTDDMSFSPHNPSFYFDTYINVDYKPEEKSCPHFLAYLDQVFRDDKETIGNIIRLGGYLLDYNPENMQKCNKMFLFDGPGGSGKSTLINTFKLFFSKDQLTSLSLDNLAADDFKKEALIVSRFNMCGEQKRNYIDAENIKQIVEGGSITINRKFKTPLTFYPKTKIVVACNGLPRFNDTSDGIYRRLLIFRFKNQYLPVGEYEKVENPAEYHVYPQDRNLFAKIEKEKEAIFNLFLEGLKMLRENDFGFVESASSQQAMDDFKNDNDVAREFLLEKYVVDSAAFTPVMEIYNNFRLWHRDNVNDSYSFKFRSAEMGKRIKEVFKVDCNGRQFFKNGKGETEYLRTYPIRKLTHNIDFDDVSTAGTLEPRQLRLDQD